MALSGGHASNASCDSLAVSEEKRVAVSSPGPRNSVELDEAWYFVKMSVSILPNVDKVLLMFQ